MKKSGWMTVKELVDRHGKRLEFVPGENGAGIVADVSGLMDFNLSAVSRARRVRGITDGIALMVLEIQPDGLLVAVSDAPRSKSILLPMNHMVRPMTRDEINAR